MNDSTAAEASRALAIHLHARRAAILHAWRDAVSRDTELGTASNISRAQFNDHIPQVLEAFERHLCAQSPGADARAVAEEHEGAAEHGLHRWQQGYDQRETMLEWSHLHLCLLDEVESFGAQHPDLDSNFLPTIRRELVRLCNAGVVESAARYTALLRAEAASRVTELEHALEQVTMLERQRAETWREAAHDLRGSVSAVSGAAAVLNHENLPVTLRSQTSQLLRRSIVSLHEMLSDLMSLARLEAGHDQRNVAAFDATELMKNFCEVMRPLAAERGLFLRCEGPDSLKVEGDAPKVQRIAQNLVLNALTATGSGGVTIAWQPGEGSRARQWTLSVEDTGPGFNDGSAAPVAQALQKATEDARELEGKGRGDRAPAAPSGDVPGVAPIATQIRANPGEGIGLSIVKRLCELLDASLELVSTPRGSRFRITFPREYSARISGAGASSAPAERRDG